MWNWKVRNVYSENAVHKSKQTHKEESLVGVLSSPRFSLQKEGNYAATERHIDFRWIINFFRTEWLPLPLDQGPTQKSVCSLLKCITFTYIQYRRKWIEGEGSRTWNSISIRHALGVKKCLEKSTQRIRSFITHSGEWKISPGCVIFIYSQYTTKNIFPFTFITAPNACTEQRNECRKKCNFAPSPAATQMLCEKNSMLAFL